MPANVPHRPKLLEGACQMSCWVFVDRRDEPIGATVPQQCRHDGIGVSDDAHARGA